MRFLEISQITNTGPLLTKKVLVNPEHIISITETDYNYGVYTIHCSVPSCPNTDEYGQGMHVHPPPVPTPLPKEQTIIDKITGKRILVPESDPIPRPIKIWQGRRAIGSLIATSTGTYQCTETVDELKVRLIDYDTSQMIDTMEYLGRKND